MRRSLTEATELEDHREVVPDRPALGDAAVTEPVRERHVPGADSLGQLEAPEPAAGPVDLAGAELHDQVVLGDHERLHPTGRVPVPGCRAQELPGALDALRQMWRERVVDEVRGTQRIEAGQVTCAVAEL